VVDGRWQVVGGEEQDSGFRSQEAEEQRTGYRGQGKGPILDCERIALLLVGAAWWLLLARWSV